MMNRMNHVVVVVPVNSDVNEAENVAEKYWQERFDGFELRAMWNFEFEHHDGDDDGEYTVGKRLHAVFSHGRL